MQLKSGDYFLNARFFNSTSIRDNCDVYISLVFLTKNIYTLLKQITDV